jgi:hypothetical protein
MRPVSELPEEDVVINSSTTFPVADPTAHRFRTYRGRLVLGKPAEERETIADRIARRGRKTSGPPLLPRGEASDQGARRRGPGQP